MEDLPEKCIIPNPYNIPIHDQGDKPSCSTQALAAMCEYELSGILEEQVLIDTDDLWEKQLKYGTANEHGDTIEDCIKISDKYGMLFRTESGKRGIFYREKGFEFFD